MNKSVVNIYQFLKKDIKSELRKIKLTNSMLEDYKQKNMLKSYSKIEFYLIKLGKTNTFKRFWINWKSEKD